MTGPWAAAARAELDRRDAAHRAQAAVDRARAIAHRQVEAELDALWRATRDAVGDNAVLEEIVDLHQPRVEWADTWLTHEDLENVYCSGCDATDETDPPDWPCATFRLIRDRL